MIREVTAGGLVFSAESPKICAPVSGTSLEEVLWEIRSLAEQPVDLIEWRADFFREDILSALPKIREEAGQMPLLFTLRTKDEGGNRETQGYGDLLAEVIRSRRITMVDIELSAGEDLVRSLVEKAKKRQIVTVISAHFFTDTPEKDVLADLFAKMEAVGGDIPKVAVMPNDFEATLKLMEAAFAVSHENAPLIAVAMGRLGSMSRLCPGQFGSCLTFAAGKLTSAPGQLRPQLVRSVLDAVQ